MRKMKRIIDGILRFFLERALRRWGFQEEENGRLYVDVSDYSRDCDEADWIPF